MRAELREALPFSSPSLRVRAESTGGGEGGGRNTPFLRLRTESAEALLVPMRAL